MINEDIKKIFPTVLLDLFYGLYCLSFRHYDKREPIDRLLEDKAFDTSASLIELGYRPVPLEIALQKDKIVFDD